MTYESGEDGVKYLQRLLRDNRNPLFAQMVSDRDAVHREYGRLFYPNNLLGLTAADFKGFLLYENNRHWWGIHRHQAKLVADMDRLRSVLQVLLDQSKPIEERLDRIEPPTGPKPLPGLGKAVYTPILHVVYPDRYGVWNSVSEEAMKRLRLWPVFDRGSSQGERYLTTNDVLKGVAGQLGVDLWTLDSLWWLTEVQHEPQRHQFSGGDGSWLATGGPMPRQATAAATFVCSRVVISLNRTR